MTKEFVCCNHPYQNSKYNGKTLHNQKANGEYRCTVCGNTYKTILTKKTK